MTAVHIPVDFRQHRAGRLSGEGLVLRSWEGRDLLFMVELFDDPDVALRTPLPAPFTVPDAADRIAQGNRLDCLLLAVTTDGERPLGEVLLKATGDAAYVIGRRHRRQGLALRALRLLVDHAHDALELPVVRLEIEPDNHASVATAQAAGFRLGRTGADVVEDKGRRCVLDMWVHTCTSSLGPIAASQPRRAADSTRAGSTGISEASLGLGPPLAPTQSPMPGG